MRSNKSRRGPSVEREAEKEGGGESDGNNINARQTKPEGEGCEQKCNAECQ